MYLLATNVISEFRKGPRANAGVLRFFAAVDSSSLFLASQVLGEIQAGIAKLRREGSPQSAERAAAYERWLDHLLEQFADRVLPFDTEAARVWGSLLSHQKKDPHTVDKQIAAIALVNSLVMVTRDKGAAFGRMLGDRLLDPFDA